MEKEGAPITKSNKVPDAFRVPESGKANAAPTPEMLLRKYDLLGKSLWIAMGAGILITLWTIAAFVAGPAAPLPATTETENTAVPADTMTTAGQDTSPPITVEKSAADATTETKNPPVNQKPQDNPQVRQPVRRVPSTNKVQPEQTPEKKQQEKDQSYEPTDEQQYQQQQQQQVPKSAD